MRARSWLLLAAGAAVATAAGRAALRAGRTAELTTGSANAIETGADGEHCKDVATSAGSQVPALARQDSGQPSLRSGLRRFTDQARDFVRIVSVESAAKESELRARLGLDDQSTSQPTERPTDL